MRTHSLVHRWLSSIWKLALPISITPLLISLGVKPANANLIEVSRGKPTGATGSYGIYVPSRGNDGDPSSIWNGGAHQACWMVDLQAVVPIQAILVSSNQFGEGGNRTLFQVTSSLDGNSWSPVGPTYSGVGDQSFQISAGGTQMRFIRYCTLPGSSQWATLGELRAFAYQAAPQTQPPPRQQPGPPVREPCVNGATTRSPFDPNLRICGEPKSVPSSRPGETMVIPNADIQPTPYTP